MIIKNKSEIISRFLTPAIKFWLRSQLDGVEDLTMEIHGGDKQILTGKIDQVFLQANKAIYQGIHITKAVVNSENIAINLGGILRGKPFKLLEPIFVNGELIVSLNDMQISLNSKILNQGLIDLMSLLLMDKKIDNYQQILSQYQFNWQDVILDKDKFIFKAILIKNTGEESDLSLMSNLCLKNKHTLLFNDIKINKIPELNILSINDFEVDLGSEVALDKLVLNSDKLYCFGKVKIIS